MNEGMWSIRRRRNQMMNMTRYTHLCWLCSAVPPSVMIKLLKTKLMYLDR